MYAVRLGAETSSMQLVMYEHWLPLSKTTLTFFTDWGLAGLWTLALAVWSSTAIVGTHHSS